MYLRNRRVIELGAELEALEFLQEGRKDLEFDPHLVVLVFLRIVRDPLVSEWGEEVFEGFGLFACLDVIGSAFVEASGPLAGAGEVG
jgi:hypothetical protein